MIEEIVRTHSSPKQLIVVSSDHRLHKAALRRNAQPIDSDVWYDNLEQDFESMDQIWGNRNPVQADSDSQLDLEKEASGLDKIDWFKEFGIQDE